MKVGGREFDQRKEDVELAMRGQVSETIQKYVVEVNGTVYPPKQVLARATGWDRQSFTTMEAQRVLTKIGFVCHEAGKLPGGCPGWVQTTSEEPELKASDRLRIAALEAAVATAQEAIAGLSARVRTLERAH
jgi:hypothetical protein